MIGGNFGGDGAGAKAGITPDAIMAVIQRAIDAGGWQGIDALQLLPEAMRQQAVHVAFDDIGQAFRDCFRTPAGNRVLQYLIDNVLLLPSAGLMPGKTVEEHAAFAIAGDAQKGLVWEILKKIAVADAAVNGPAKGQDHATSA